MPGIFELPLTYTMLFSAAVVGAYCAVRPALERDIAVFVFMLMSVLETIWLFHLTLNLKWAVYETEGVSLAVTSILRAVVRPVLYLFFILAAMSWERIPLRVAAVIAILGVMHAMDRILVEAGHLKFVHWNYFACMLVNAVMMTLAFLSVKAFLRYAGRKRVTA